MYTWPLADLMVLGAPDIPSNIFYSWPTADIMAEYDLQ